MAETHMTAKRGVKFNPEREKAEFNQYWYSPHTIDALLSEVRHHATACAFLSTPSLYFALVAGNSNNNNNKKLSCDGGEDSAAAVGLVANSRLFEFDRQWEEDPGFVPYDFRRPDRLPVKYLAAFDYVLADPPFITEDVWAAYVRTAKALLKPGGKVMFTTVMENHTVLEGLLDAPLFIASFRPAIAHLTYQYVCFTNYKVTKIVEPNAELPPEDPKIMAAIQMANDLRESEQAFVVQMQRRARDGESPLPTDAHREAPADAIGEQLHMGTMRWNYIPAGLTMYANGDAAPPTERRDEDYGDAYREIGALRGVLDEFKRCIDLSQKHLDVLLKLQQKRARQTGAEVCVTDAAIGETRQQFAATLDDMRAIIATAEVSEARLAAAGDRAVLSYILAMQDCVKAYATVPLRRQDLNELAADATRKYKSPVFNRMKELLQKMKEIKKQRQRT